MRRFRTGLAVAMPLVAKESRAKLRPLDRRVRHLARLAGQVRDRDVALELLASVDRFAAPGRETESLNRYRARLHDDARTGRELLGAFLRSESQAGLFEELQETLRTASPSSRRPSLERDLADHWAEGADRVVAAHRKAHRRPSMKRLHRLRIRVRQLRHLTDLANVVVGADVSRTAPFRRLQEELGVLHDLDVLVSNLDPGARTSHWAEALRAERRRLRKKVRKALQAQRKVRVRRKGPTGPARRSGPVISLGT